MTRPSRPSSRRATAVARILLGVGLCVAVSLRNAAAQPTEHGGEFVANTYLTGGQSEAGVALGEDGDVMVVWRSTHGTDPEGVYARRFATRGAPLDAQFQVNSYTTSVQWKPAVAAGSGGDFILLWHSDGSSAGDTSSFSVQGKVFDGATATLGPQFQVNNVTTGSQFAPAVAADAAGNFVVVWTSAASAGDDTSFNSIQARLFDAAGSALGDQFQVNSYTSGDQQAPEVARNGSGEFVVVWYGGAESGYGLDVLGQRFDANGDPIGGEFLVNSVTSGSQAVPGVGIGSDGNFLVAWESDVSAGDDDDQTSIQTRWFDTNGVAGEPESQVNVFTTSFQYRTAVAGRGDGYVVTWSSGTEPEEDVDLSVQARRFDSAGNALEEPFQVNAFTTGSQTFSAVDVDSRGNFVVAFESWASPVDDNDVRAQSYDALFRDDFESADPNRWVLGPP